MKKVILSLVLTTLIVLFACSCGKYAETRYDCNMKKYVTLPESELGEVMKAKDFDEFLENYIAEQVENKGILTHDYEATVKKGDCATITVKGDLEQKQISITAGDTDGSYGKLGKEIIGKKAGETFNFVFENGENAVENLEITVEYISIAELNLAAATAMGYEDEEEAEKELKKLAVYDYAVKWLVESSEIKGYPETEYKELYDAQFNYYKQLASGYGLSVDQYREREDLSLEEFENMLEEKAKQKMDAEMPIYAYARANKIKITEEDISNKVKAIAEEKGAESQAVIEQTPHRDIELAVIKDFVVKALQAEN